MGECGLLHANELDTPELDETIHEQVMGESLDNISLRLIDQSSSGRLVDWLCKGFGWDRGRVSADASAIGSSPPSASTALALAVTSIRPLTLSRFSRYSSFARPFMISLTRRQSALYTASSLRPLLLMQ